MNQQALDNRAYVRNLILEKDIKFAHVLAEFVHTPLHYQSEHFSRVVGFGDCDTEKPPRFGKDELS